MQFSDAQPSVLVYDSGTSVGLFLTQELIGKGLKVHLLLSEASANSSLYESIVKDKNLFEIHEFSGDCLSNYNAIIFPHQPQKIFIPPPKLVLNKLFSSELDNSPMQDVDDGRVALIGYAQNQGIEVIQTPGYYCTDIEMEHIIDAIIAYLKSSNRYLLVNSLDVPLWISSQDNLPLSSNFEDMEFERLQQYYSLQLRDVIKVVFEVVGAELEFCGRGPQERGVIVDYENELLVESTHIRLGNTVVKINDTLHEQLSDNFTSPVKTSDSYEINDSLIDWLKILTHKKVLK